MVCCARSVLARGSVWERRTPGVVGPKAPHVLDQPPSLPWAVAGNGGAGPYYGLYPLDQ
jgi:hypothetical protein